MVFGAQTGLMSLQMVLGALSVGDEEWRVIRQSGTGIGAPTTEGEVGVIQGNAFRSTPQTLFAAGGELVTQDSWKFITEDKTADITNQDTIVSVSDPSWKFNVTSVQSEANYYLVLIEKTA